MKLELRIGSELSLSEAYRNCSDESRQRGFTLRAPCESAVCTGVGCVRSSRLRSASLRDCRRDAPRIQPPHRARADIRKPHRAESNPNIIAAFTSELPDFS